MICVLITHVCRKQPAGPALWRIDWGINVQAFGTGVAAIKYLGTYVFRTAIGDSRIVASDGKSDTFRWKNRAKGDHIETKTLPGVEFVRRYLRHVLPRKMHGIRYYGFCHPAAKVKRERIAFHSGMPLLLGTPAATKPDVPTGSPSCPCCRKPMVLIRTFKADRCFMPVAAARPAQQGPTKVLPRPPFLMKMPIAVRTKISNDDSAASCPRFADSQRNRNPTDKTCCQSMVFRCKFPLSEPMPPAKRFVLASVLRRFRPRSKHKTHSAISR